MGNVISIVKKSLPDEQRGWRRGGIEWQHYPLQILHSEGVCLETLQYNITTAYGLFHYNIEIYMSMTLPISTIFKHLIAIRFRGRILPDLDVLFLLFVVCRNQVPFNI